MVGPDPQDILAVARLRAFPPASLLDSRNPGNTLHGVTKSARAVTTHRILFPDVLAGAGRGLLIRLSFLPF